MTTYHCLHVIKYGNWEIDLIMEIWHKWSAKIRPRASDCMTCILSMTTNACLHITHSYWEIVLIMEAWHKFTSQWSVKIRLMMSDEWLDDIVHSITTNHCLHIKYGYWEIDLIMEVWHKFTGQWSVKIRLMTCLL